MGWAKINTDGAVTMDGTVGAGGKWEVHGRFSTEKRALLGLGNRIMGAARWLLLCFQKTTVNHGYSYANHCACRSAKEALVSFTFPPVFY